MSELDELRAEMEMHRAVLFSLALALSNEQKRAVIRGLKDQIAGGTKSGRMCEAARDATQSFADLLKRLITIVDEHDGGDFD